MKKYSEYKNSGVEWIGEIPNKWITCTLGKVSAISTGNTPPKNGSQEYYAVQGLAWVKPDNLSSFKPIVKTTEYLNTDGELLARIAPPFTPLICCIGTIGKFGFSESGVAYNQQVNAVSFDKKKIFWKFGLYFLSCQSAQHWYFSNGNVVQILNAQNQKQITICYPSIIEQQSIAFYLDRKTAQIDSIIADKVKLIDLLKEKRQAIISEAVTKGLDSTVPMKDSGVDWIGQIPAHWEIKKIKYVFEIVKRIYGKEDRDILSITQKGIKIRDISSNEGQLAQNYSNYQVVNKNDFAMNSMDLLTGFVDCSQFEGVTSPDYRVFRFIPNKEMNHSYYKLLFQMCYSKRIFYRFGQGVSTFGRWRLQTETFNNFYIPVPPVNEQIDISLYIVQQLESVDNLIISTEQQIFLLKEYRQSIISEAVTGKVKIDGGDIA